MKPPHPDDYHLFDYEQDSFEYGSRLAQYERAVDVYEGEIVRADEAIRALIRISSVRVEMLSDRLSRDHRTHQQSACRGIRLMLQAMIMQDTDLRNEGMKAFANAAYEATEKIGLPYI